ncbi:insulinoma-associated protein 1a-like [Diadema setosum]|uniref:insulinoma-associated protein 1a-like n=1 Tax=Diadema setosum TaxID=31175 RepID=UPI003B3B9049
MPRNFLVKRTKRTCSVTYRQRNSDDEFDDLGFVDGDLTDSYIRPFNSPDSGYSQSPVAPVNHKESSFAFHFDRDVMVGSPNHLQACGPVPHQTLTPCFTSDFTSITKSPVTPNTKLTLSAPPALGTKRPNADSDHHKSHRAKKPKAARKLTFEEDNRSPVHGTIIREDVDAASKMNGSHKMGDPNGSKLGGDFMCKLCKESYPDPLSLAQHKCSCIVHVEYRCPECDKVFNCPANLASHRRWHKPKPNNNNNNNTNNNNNSSSNRTPSTNSPRILPAGAAKDALKQFNPTTVLNIPDATRKVDSGSEGSISRGSTPSPLHHLLPTPMDTPRSTPSPSYPQNNNIDVNKTSKEDMLYNCDQCGRKFRRPANLRRHMQQHSETEETFPCQYCGQVFSSLTSRATHVLTHAVGTDNMDPEANRDYSCGICGGNFHSRVALERHEKLQHSNPGEMYHCKYCSSIFPTSPGLTRHINKRHPSENRQVILLQMPPIRT